MKIMKIKILFLFFFLNVSGQPVSVQKSTPTIVRVIPHDSKAFTQGLFYYKGLLYESTGLYDQSSLRCLDPVDGHIVKKIEVPDVFAEGLCRMDSLLVQLTWKEKSAIRYSLADFSLKGFFSYEGEGWGLTSDGSSFIMSNGTDTLYIRNKHFRVTGKVAVTLSGRPLTMLNELEYVHGAVYTNVWFNTSIYVIRLSTGTVTRVIDCSSLVRRNGSHSEQDVLNGIAYNGRTGTFYITGKNWRYIFEVKL
jgi:glutaminyl-peptide cyclotransferase